jgi:hypothetical protein
MKKLIAPVLSSLCIGVVLAGPPQPSKDPTDVKAIEQLEQDMGGDAMVRVDMDRLDQIYADVLRPSGPPATLSPRKIFYTLLDPSMTNSSPFKMVR